MSASETVVIVGSGQGGWQVATSLREDGFAGRVVLVGDEPGLPYHRPPLSKAYLTGKADRETVLLRAESFFAERRIELRAPERATRIDRDAKALHLATGESLAYDHLVLATGARNRLLPVPGAEAAGILYLRTLADADVLKDRLTTARRIVVVGAGFIGLEFAAVAAAQGLDVTVLEATSRPMSRALSAPMSDFFRAAHERAGLRLRFGSVVTRVLGQGGQATGIELGDGERLAADLVVAGIGVVPNVELAAEAGLSIANGIEVDARLATADPSISAIGDGVSFPSPFAGGERVRLESVQNAVDQAKAVAARLAGRPVPPYAPVPWFWSDQGPLKLQMAGLGHPDAEPVLRGDPAGGAFSVFLFRAGRLLSVESVNRPADHMMARRLLASGAALSPAEVADPGFDLKARATAGKAG